MFYWNLIKLKEIFFKKTIQNFILRFILPLITVFDDGDEKTLRRSSLCLKGERHFAESEVNFFFLM